MTSSGGGARDGGQPKTRVSFVLAANTDRPVTGGGADFIGVVA